MNARRSLLVVPNHSMVIEGDLLRIEWAEAELLRAVRERFAFAGIAAFVEGGNNSSLAGSVPRAHAASHRLNQLDHSRSRLARLINYVGAAATLPFVLCRYDLLYIFCPGHCGLLAACWARLLGRPYGLYVRGTWLSGRAETAYWWRWVFRGATFMIATGESFRRRLSRYCSQVVNEVPLTELRPCNTHACRRATRSAATRLLFAGRLAESKGIYDVVRALALLRGEGRDVTLTIAGGGVQAELRALDELQELLRVRAAVEILGHVPPARLTEVYRDSDLFVFPSYFAEGFPRVLYEAMMFGLPIVTCQMPGTDGFLVDNSNCLYCQPSDPQALAACLRRLLDDAVCRERLGSRARADIESLYESFVDTSHAEQLLRFAGCT
jgi:glycosyltransferase involved in cell wall biosynthesis